MPTSPDSVTSDIGVTATMIGPPTVGAGLTASGSTQSDALPIWDDIAIFTSVPVGAGCVLKNKGAIIENRSANALLIYPQLDAQIESYGTNVAVSIAAGGSATFERVSSTLYRVR